MSNLTGNKIAGGLLATFLVIVGVPQVAGMIFDKTPPAKPGYFIAVQEETAGGAAAVDNPPDWGTILPTANVANGEAQAKACQACHNLDQGGPNMTGPNLFGVVGRAPGSHPGFEYSDGMKAFGAAHPQWTYDELYTFLKGPGRYVNGTKMTFVGFKDPQTRIDVIAYLHTLGATLPVPTPDPTRAPGAAAAAGGAAPVADGAAAPAAGAAAPAAGGTPAAAAAAPAAAAATPAKPAAATTAAK